MNNAGIEDMAAEFLGIMMTYSAEDLTCVVQFEDARMLAAALINIENSLMGPLTPDQQVSENILYTILGILRRETLALEPNLSRTVINLLQVICQKFNQPRAELIRIGIMDTVSEIMKKEIEYLKNLQGLKGVDYSIISAHIISPFFPAISVQIYKDINSFSRNILYMGPSSGRSIVPEIKDLLQALFPTLYDVCKMSNCPTIYQTLLLKMIYWANETNTLTGFVTMKELVDFAQILLTKGHKDAVVMGFAIVNMLLAKHFQCLKNEDIYVILKSKIKAILAWPIEARYNWIYQIYNVLISYWLSEETTSKFKIDEENYISHLGHINVVLNSLKLQTGNGQTTEINLVARYASLRELVNSMLNLPDMRHHKGILTVNTEGIKRFKGLVKLLISIIETELIRLDLMEIKPDLVDDGEGHTVATPMDITLDLFKSPSFNRVLGASKSPGELSSNPLVRALRLLSILYEVNENWGVLFGSLSTERLIDRNCFVSLVLEEVARNVRSRSYNRFNMVPRFVINITADYPFLIKFKNRNYFSSVTMKACAGVNAQCITRPQMEGHMFDVPRKDLLNNVIENMDVMARFASQIWKFRFLGEPGTGEGPTREFYSEFSLDCQRSDIGLWAGEPGAVIEDISYVHSQSGLFPSPKSTDETKHSHLKAIGLVMAKSMLDKHQMDINFSNALNKCLFKKNLDVQHLSLIDVKDVMPSIYKFLEHLVDAWREKFFVRTDNSLTPEEQNLAISSITCNGCPFEDLCVNFTLPGYPDLEMVEGGNEIFLNVYNIEEYLKLLVWWMLYKPQQSIKQISGEFKKIINPYFMKYLYPYEYEEIMCGLKTEQWTVDYLKKNCALEMLTADKPVVQYLFEVLSSLSASDQRNFLQFLTGAPRLPVGGLAALNPKFTIERRGADGNPDNYLPSAMTCTNTLFIVEYNSKEALEAKLLQAIRESTNSFHYY